MDYRFKPMNKTCAGTGRPLVPGSLCYSVLIEVNGQQERRDYSAEAWQGLPAGAVGYWKCKVPLPEKRDMATMDTESLFQYFEQLVEEANPGLDKLRYVLTLHLLQKRRLVLEGSRRCDDVEYLEIVGSRGEGPFEIRDQQLTQDELQELRSALNHQLTTQWNAA